MRPLPTLVLFLALTPCAIADDWPQWMGPGRDAIWAETGIIDRLSPEGPNVLWRTAVGGGYAGPAVASGKVYVSDYVKSSGDDMPNPIKRSELQGSERVSCFDAANGETLWSHTYDCPYPAGPRCTPTVHDGKVYTLGAMGNLFCLDAATGNVLWSKDFTKDYGAEAPLWGFCGHPLIDGQRLICIVGGNGTTAVAFDKDTGNGIWRSLSSKQTGYSAPTLIQAGGVAQLLIWHGEALNAINPETGDLYWSFPLAPQMGMAIMVPRKDGDYLFAGAVYGTAVGLKLAADKPAVALAWRGPPNMKDAGLYPMNMTPFAEDGVLYGVDQPGQFRAVKIDTGERLWESWEPVTGETESRPVYAATVFVVKNGDRFFLFNEKGELMIAKLSPDTYEELGRWKMLEPTGTAFGRDVVWSHPAFANRCIYCRNDKELICVSLAK